MRHEDYMKLALEQAERGVGKVNPNPLVGAVIVKNGIIIGCGTHAAYGLPHAERDALAQCTTSPEGATLYVTLEPCSHYGKTPPCTEAVIESGITTVVVGTRDPNPLVAGTGIKALLDAGIEVIEGVCEDECLAINRVFFYHIQTGLPYVVMKYAMTMDGKIATHNGLSKWITGQTARACVHEDRVRYSGIMVGIGTVLADDPLLTSRIEGARNPLRIICDTNLRTPLSSQIVRTANEVPTLIACSVPETEKHEPYLAHGCEVLVFPQEGGHLNLSALMQELGKRRVDGILLEGGGGLNWSMLQGGHVNAVQAYIAPKIFGGVGAPSPIGGLGVDGPNDAFILERQEVTILGDDVLIESELASPHIQDKAPVGQAVRNVQPTLDEQTNPSPEGGVQ